MIYGIAEDMGKIAVSFCKTVSGITEDIKSFNWSNEDEKIAIESNLFSAYKGQLVIRGSINGRSGSFGVMFLTRNNPDENEVKHERGHLDQMRELGLFVYSIGIAIPSIINGDADLYYNQPWEITADMYGGVDRSDKEKYKDREEAKVEGEKYMARLKSIANILDRIFSIYPIQERSKYDYTK